MMIPPPPSAPEERVPLRARPVDLPAFGQGGNGQSRREGDRGPEAGRPTGDADAREMNVPSYMRMKQEDETSSPLDEYFL